MAARLSLRSIRSALAAPAVRPRSSILRPTSSLRPSAHRFASSLGGAPRKGVKVVHVFSALALLGIGATSYGLYQFYQTFTAYPDTPTHPIRSKLRAALRAQASGEFERASSFFDEAYSLALELAPTGELGSTEQALIRTTGIAVRWGGMWEEVGELGRAIAAYDTGFQPVAAAVDGYKGGGAVQLSRAEVMRGAGIALKLGDLWVRLGGLEGDQEAERYYTWAVEELMRLTLTDKQKAKVKAEMQRQEGGPTEAAAPPAKPDEQDDLDLPGWVGEVELVAAFERLGELYSRQGKIEFAQPLFQQAIALLLPPPRKDASKAPPPPIPQRCHAATLMNNLSSALVAAPSPTADAIDASARWARQALHIANACKREADKARNGKDVPLGQKEEGECELTAVVSSYNLGKLSELSKDPVSAEQWFVQSGKLAVKLGLLDAARQANEAIRRLKHPTVRQ
ncbi:hypothetical protein JCM21900_006582 [Sporobolomyces salmonicolor]